MKKLVLFSWIWLSIITFPFFNNTARAAPLDSAIGAKILKNEFEAAAELLLELCKSSKNPEKCFKGALQRLPLNLIGKNAPAGWKLTLLETVAEIEGRKARIGTLLEITEQLRFQNAANRVADEIKLVQNRLPTPHSPPPTSAPPRSSGWGRFACGVLRVANVMATGLLAKDLVDLETAFQESSPLDCPTINKHMTMLAETLTSNQKMIKPPNGVSIETFQNSAEEHTKILCFKTLAEYFDKGCVKEIDKASDTAGGSETSTSPIPKNYPTAVVNYCKEYAPKLKQFNELEAIETEAESCSDEAAEDELENGVEDEKGSSSTTSSTMPPTPEGSSSSTSTSTTMPSYAGESPSSTYVPTTTTMPSAPEKGSSSTYLPATTTIPSEVGGTTTTMPNGDAMN